MDCRCGNDSIRHIRHCHAGHQTHGVNDFTGERRFFQNMIWIRERGF
jgi:hypothetical protein